MIIHIPIWLAVPGIALGSVFALRGVLWFISTLYLSRYFGYPFK